MSQAKTSERGGRRRSLAPAAALGDNNISCARSLAWGAKRASEQVAAAGF